MSARVCWLTVVALMPSSHNFASQRHAPVAHTHLAYLFKLRENKFHTVNGFLHANIVSNTIYTPLHHSWTDYSMPWLRYYTEIMCRHSFCNGALALPPLCQHFVYRSFGARAKTERERKKKQKTGAEDKAGGLKHFPIIVLRS